MSFEVHRPAYCAINAIHPIIRYTFLRFDFSFDRSGQRDMCLMNTPCPRTADTIHPRPSLSTWRLWILRLLLGRFCDKRPSKLRLGQPKTPTFSWPSSSRARQIAYWSPRRKDAVPSTGYKTHTRPLAASHLADLNRSYLLPSYYWLGHWPGHRVSLLLYVYSLIFFIDQSTHEFVQQLTTYPCFEKSSVAV